MDPTITVAWEVPVYRATALETIIPIHTGRHATIPRDHKFLRAAPTNRPAITDALVEIAKLPVMLGQARPDDSLQAESNLSDERHQAEDTTPNDEPR